MKVRKFLVVGLLAVGIAIQSDAAVYKTARKTDYVNKSKSINKFQPLTLFSQKSVADKQNFAVQNAENDPLLSKKENASWFARSWLSLKRLWQKESEKDVKKSLVMPFKSKTFKERATDLGYKKSTTDLDLIKRTHNPLDKKYLNQVVWHVNTHKDLTENEKQYIKNKLKLFLPSKYKGNESPDLVRKDFYSIITVPSNILNHDVLQKFNKELDLLKTLYIQFFKNKTFKDIEEGFNKLKAFEDISEKIAENKDLLEKVKKALPNYENKILNRNQINIKAQLISDLKNKEKNEEELLKQSNKLLQLNEIKNAIELINIESKKRNNNIEKIINSFILETYFFKNILKCLEEEKNDIKEREKEIDNQKKKNEKTDQLKIDVHCLKVFLEKCKKFEVKKDYVALLKAIKDDYFDKINKSINEYISANDLIQYVDDMIYLIKENNVAYFDIKKVKNNIENMLDIKRDIVSIEEIFKKYYKEYKNNKIDSLNDLHNTLVLTIKNKSLLKEVLNYITNPIKIIENIDLYSMPIDIDAIIREAFKDSEISTEQINAFVNSLHGQDYADSYKILVEIKKYLEEKLSDKKNVVSVNDLKNFKHRFQILLIGFIATEGIEQMQKIFNIR